MGKRHYCDINTKCHRISSGLEPAPLATFIALFPQILEQEEALDLTWCKLLHLETREVFVSFKGRIIRDPNMTQNWSPTANQCACY